MKKATITLALLSAILIAGCATQPSRSQTQNISRNTFYLCCVPAGTNTLDLAGIPAAMGDIFSQAMMIEQSGGTGETNTPQFDISPQTTIPLGDSALGALGTLTGQAAEGAARGLTTKPATVDPACPDGNCAPPPT